MKEYTIGNTTYVGAHDDVVAAVRSRNSISWYAIRLQIQYVTKSIAEVLIPTFQRFGNATRELLELLT